MEKLKIKWKRMKAFDYTDDWKNFETFKNWAMKSGYTPANVLGKGYYCALFRNDNNKPYSPDNCRWEIRYHLLRWMKEEPFTYTLNGVQQTLSLYEWCEALNKDYSRVGNLIVKENVSYPEALGLKSVQAKAIGF